MQNLEDVAKLTLTNTDSFDSPKKLVYLKEFVPDLPQEQTDQIDQFVKDVEGFTGIKAERVSLEDVWASNPPEGAESKTLQEFMRDVGSPMSHACTVPNNHRRPSDYSATITFTSMRIFKAPTVTVLAKSHSSKQLQTLCGMIDSYENHLATLKLGRQLGKGVSDEQRDQYLERIRLFQTWFTENFISPDENTAVILPYSVTKASYRQDGPGYVAIVSSVYDDH